MGHDVRHPGEIVQDFLTARHITTYTLVRDAGVNPGNLNKLIGGRAGLGPVMALRLGRYFDNGPKFWMDLQVDYDLAQAQDELRDELTEIVRWPAKRESPIYPKPSRAVPPELHKPRPVRPAITDEQVAELMSAPDMASWVKVARAVIATGVTQRAIARAVGVTDKAISLRLKYYPEEGDG